MIYVKWKSMIYMNFYFEFLIFLTNELTHDRWITYQSLFNNLLRKHFYYEKNTFNIKISLRIFFWEKFKNHLLCFLKSTRLVILSKNVYKGKCVLEYSIKSVVSLNVF